MPSSVAVLIVVLVAICGGLVWRAASRRQALPCPVSLRWLVEMENPFARAARAEAIVRSLELRPGMRVLDFGCGPGRVTIPLARAVAPGEVVAADMQPGMLARVRERADAAGLRNIRPLEVRAGVGKLGHACFDRAVLASVLGEIPDRPSAIREIFDSLKPEGLLAVTEIIIDPHFQTRSAVRRLGSAAGFRERGCLGRSLAYTVVFEKGADRE